MDPNQTPEKAEPQQRIPSPGSASSVHSIRPLEWDSGADIGYQNPSQHPNLSTVERIALQNGSNNLFKAGGEPSTYSKSQTLGNPLAESSPFIKVQTAASVQPKDTRGPLVDYTIGSDRSFDDQSILVTKSEPVKSLSENSKSLEDLRRIKRAHTLNGKTTKSSSSQNLSSSGEKYHKKFASSSSISTVIPQEFHRQVSNKSIQVDENTLAELLRNVTDFKNDNCSTYTINSSKCSSERSKSRLTESNSESVDGGSFEYVRGSQYNSKQASESNYCDSSSSAGIHTLCNEVVDGVDLITQYVNSLSVSNKKKVLQKVAKSLLNRVENKSEQGSDENSLKEVNLPASNAVLPFHVRVDTPSRLLVNEDSVFQPIQKPDRSDKSSTTSKFESTSINETKTSDSVGNTNLRKGSKRQLIQRNKSRIRESSNFSKSTSTSKSMQTYTNDTNSCAAASGTENSNKDDSNLYSLKKYLAKEREAQLLWIRSGIDHLNNLKKLYESQKILRKDLNSQKRATSSKPNVSESESSHRKQKQPHSEHRVVKRTPKCKSIQTSTSDLNAESPVVPVKISRILPNQPEPSSHTISTKKLTVKKYCKKYRDKTPHKCSQSTAENFVSENKENIKQNISKSAKKPISYTVLFDKPSGPDEIQCHKQRLAKKKAPFNEIVYIENRTRTVTPQLEIKLTDVDDQCPSLQEYLLKNKPEYVDRAEFRRQCLFEIAQLRELRDKSKNELMSLITNSDESDINTIRRHLPPAPLTVMRIFNDKALREQTKKKYQQLPEVLMKKLEQKKKENNRRNQIMAKVFTKKLQRKVLKGEIDIANSVNLIFN